MSKDCLKMDDIVSKSPLIISKLSQNELKIIRICEKCVFEKVWFEPAKERMELFVEYFRISRIPSEQPPPPCYRLE